MWDNMGFESQRFRWSEFDVHNFSDFSMSLELLTFPDKLYPYYNTLVHHLG